jgi:hypothetical protein
MEPLELLKLLTQENGPEPGAAACDDQAALLSPRMLTDAELMAHLELRDGDARAAAYDVLLRKAQSTKVTIAGMTLPEQADYWRRLAANVRPNKGAAIERADAP